MSKMRAHVAADARVTSGARRVFRGLGSGFQGLEFKQPRSGSSAPPFEPCPLHHEIFFQNARCFQP